MADPTIDPNLDPEQQNPITDNWYGELAGDNEERATQLGEFATFDDFMADYSTAKNHDWRADIAGDDDKFKSTLDRYADPQSFGNAHREAVQKIRSGEMRAELPEDADEDAIKEFRRNNNIPLEAAGYLENLPEGLVVGENDKEIMGDFMETLHGVNADPKVAHAAIDWYNKFEEAQQDMKADMDAEHTKESTDKLREDWGPDYRANMNLINSALSTFFGESASEQLINGRYLDGRGFFNDPEVMTGFAQMARMVNDIAPLVAQDADKMQSITDEIAEIQSKMGTKEYKDDEKMQARYRYLVDIQLKAGERDAA